MAKNTKTNRRKFLKALGSTSLIIGASPFSGLAANERIEERILYGEKNISANDKIQIAAIGTGIMGHQNMDSALKVPGIELIAACDLYDGRLKHIKEKYGKEIDVTRDYRELLNRKDIDAVLVSTTDIWHARIAIDAMESGKHVYCEKPMVKLISEGLPLIEKYKETQKVLQVGSQTVSGLAVSKAKELYQAGEIGKLNCIEAAYDRQSALGAWQYTLPTDASPKTVDWDAFIAGAEKSDFDATKFFRWRNYKEFGTGVSGDLFVHLLSSIHVILDSMGPNKVFSSGQLSYWNDGRNVPDVMAAIMEYPESSTHPEFQLTLRVNFASGKGPTNFVRFIGDEGVMEVSGNSVTINHSIMPEAPGIGGWDSLDTYPESMQKELLDQYNRKYSEKQKTRPTKAPIRYVAENQDKHKDHFINFFEGVRKGSPVIEGPEFGFRACAPCLLCNDSYFGEKIMNWDPVKMKLTK
jgi:predicted dehydrogenase